MTTTRDAQGNLHSTATGQFAEKHNSRPVGALPRSVAQRDLAELELGRQGESVLLAAALGEQHAVLVADVEHHDQVLELTQQIGELQGKDVMVVDARTPEQQ